MRLIDRDATLFDHFLHAATRHPERIALSCDARRLTYRELGAQVRHVASALRQCGKIASSERRIAVDTAPSIEGIVAMLGVLGSGAACVPVDTSLSARQVDALVTRVQPDVFVHRGVLTTIALQRMQERSVACVSVEALIAESSNPLESVDAALPLAAERLAFALWSTGTDSRQGASLLSHRNVLRLFDATESSFEFGHDDVWLLSGTGTTSMWMVLGALLYGGELVMPAASGVDQPAANARELARLIARHRVTVWSPTLPSFRALCHYLAEAPPRERSDMQLSFVILGGERPDAALLRQWYDTIGDDAVLVHQYGMAEAASLVAIHPLGKADARSDSGHVIGEPVADMRLLLLDEQFAPVPPGAIGELFVEGPGLVRGYDGEPARTATTFIPDPSAESQGQRLLRTGDLARVDGSGRFVRLGRVDRLVRIRGLRVLLDDVEAGLRRCAGVRNASVLRREGEGDCELNAWIVSTGEALSLSQLRSELAAIVPQHMLPHRYFQVPALVVAADGAFDVVELRVTGRALVDDRPLDDPASEDERVMLAVWAKALELPSLGVSDDFFSAGGDSILAVKLVLALGEAGWRVTVQELLQAGSVRSLSDRVPRNGAGLSSTSVVAAVTTSNSRSASDLQNLLIDRYRRHAPQFNGVYHVQQSFTLIDTGGPVDIDLLRACYEAEFAANSSCRTYFESTGDGFRRLIDTRPRTETMQQDVAGLDARAQDEVLQRHAYNDVRHPFDLTSTTQPLTRLALFRLSSSKVRVFKSTHHAIDDGWGQVQLVTRVLDAYERGRPSDRAYERDPFDAYVAHQQQLRDDPTVIHFWDNYPLAAECLVSVDRPSMTRIEQIVRPLSNDLVTRVTTLARQAKVQPKSVFLAATVQALSEWQAQRDVTIGIVVNGRLAQLQDALTATGLYWSLHPFTWQEAGTAMQSIERIHELLARQDAYTLYPLSRIMDAKAAGSEFRFTFNYTNYTNASAEAVSARLRTEDWLVLDNFHFPINIGLHCDEDPTQHNLRVVFDAGDDLAGALGPLLDRVESNLALLREPERVTTAREGLAATES